MGVRGIEELVAVLPPAAAGPAAAVAKGWRSWPGCGTRPWRRRRCGRSGRCGSGSPPRWRRGVLVCWRRSTPATTSSRRRGWVRRPRCSPPTRWGSGRAARGGTPAGPGCCAARSGTCPRPAPPTPPVTSLPPTWRSWSGRTGTWAQPSGTPWSTARSRTATTPPPEVAAMPERAVPVVAAACGLPWPGSVPGSRPGSARSGWWTRCSRTTPAGTAWRSWRCSRTGSCRS